MSDYNRRGQLASDVEIDREIADENARRIQRENDALPKMPTLRRIDTQVRPVTVTPTRYTCHFVCSSCRSDKGYAGPCKICGTRTTFIEHRPEPNPDYVEQGI